MAVGYQPGLGHQVSLGQWLLYQATPGPRALAAVLDARRMLKASTCSGSLNEFPDRVQTIRQSRHRLAAFPKLCEAGLMTAAMVTARPDGAGSSPAATTRMAGDLELPRPLRLLLTAGWNLTESVGLPVAAYVAACTASKLIAWRLTWGS